MGAKEIKSYDITGGPNKHMLFDACKYAYDKNSRAYVEFAVAFHHSKSPDKLEEVNIPMAITDTRIEGIKHEDSSGEKFIFHGSCKADLNTPAGYRVIYVAYKFRATYNSRTRKGKIKFFNLQ